MGHIGFPDNKKNIRKPQIFYWTEWKLEKYLKFNSISQNNSFHLNLLLIYNKNSLSIIIDLNIIAMKSHNFAIDSSET